MMLQALIAYAEREKLGDPDFDTVGVTWLIPLNLSGRMAGSPIPLCENPDESKSKPKQYARPFTSPNELNQGTKSHFLCDTLERATLFLDAKAPDKASARRVQHDYFKALLIEAASACPSEAARINAVISFLNNADEVARLHRQLGDVKAKFSENVTFAVEGVNLLESASLKQFWRARRCRASVGVTRARRICIATGELTETLDTTEKIKGVPGGLATGANLISFDKDSFCSYGLEQAQNAALSASAELKIRSSLNQLIEKSRAQRLVFNNTCYLHWSRKPMLLDPLDPIVTGDPELIERLFHSIHRGQQATGVESEAYYCLSLSCNGARIVVRDWLESTVQEINAHVAEWFEDISIVPPEGQGVKRDFKFGALLYGMVRAELDELPPQVPALLFYGALRGRSVPLPQSILAAALRRQQLDQENKLHPARLAIIKACLIRSPNHPIITNQPTTVSMTECLNPESRNPAYLCGRLFAVFAELQGAALQNVNAGVVERYYASASITPALVMGRLFRNAQFHLTKAGKGEGEEGWKKGKAINAEKDFEAITCALGDKFPATLDLEGQGCFALGYYHQKAEYRRRTADRKEQQAKESKTE